MKKFVRRDDLILLTDLVRRIKAEIGGELREAVDMVCECLNDVESKQPQLWMFSNTGGLPEPSDDHPGELMINFFNAYWWDVEVVERNEKMKDEFGQGSLELELCGRLALLNADANHLLEQVVGHVRAPIHLGASNPGYLDPQHPRFAPKLAAAVKAWIALEDERLLRGKSALQALEAWLELHHQELGLIHEIANKKNGTNAGDMNRLAVTEAAKVANWSLRGGAPKTPSN